MSKGLGVGSSDPDDLQMSSPQNIGTIGGAYIDQSMSSTKGMGTIGGAVMREHSVEAEHRRTASVSIDDLPLKEFKDSILISDNQVQIKMEEEKDDDSSEDKQTDTTSNGAMDKICSQFIVPSDLLGIDFVKPIPGPKPPRKNNKKKVKADKVLVFQETAYSCYVAYFTYIAKFLLLLAFLVYTIYFICALVYSVEGAKTLIILTSIVVVFFVYYRIKYNYGGSIYKHIFKPAKRLHKRTWPCLKW